MLETPAKFGKALMMRLNMYKLRAKLDIEDVSGTYFIYALWGGQGGEGQPDPRHTGLGNRLLTDDILPAEGAPQDYDAHRLSLGVPDSAWDFETQSVFPADANMDLLAGVDYKKGCFIGQEVVSRMHRKTTVRKRMCGVTLTGAAQAGDSVMAGGLKLGALGHVRGERAMAMIRLDRLAKAEGAPDVNGSAAAIMEPEGAKHDTQS